MLTQENKLEKKYQQTFLFKMRLVQINLSINWKGLKN